MPVDILSVLQASGTFTATQQGTGFDLGVGGSGVDGAFAGAGTSPAGLVARFVYSAAQNASGANAFTFSVEHSNDGATWFALASGAKDVVNLSTTAQSGEVFVPFETRARFIRAVATLSGAGTVPTITYSCYLAPAFP